MLRYEDGKTAFIDVSWAFPKTSSPFYSSLDIIGTDGRIEYSDKDANPMVFAGDRIEFPRYSSLLSASLEAFSDEFREFVECVHSGREPAVTTHDAYDALKIISAAEESVKKGEVIRC